MKRRCQNPDHPEYARYGGRGIGFDPAWSSFSQFITDMGIKPSPELSLERKNNNLGYSKDNCEWASKTVQSFNQRKGSDNKSGIVGVYMEKQTGMWKAYIRFKKKQITLGRFKDFFEACCARKSAEWNYYREVLERC